MKKQSSKTSKGIRIRSRIAIAFDWAGRITVIAAIFFATFFCVQTFREISYGQRLKSATLGETSQVEPESVPFLLEGDWQFAGLPWSIQVTELNGWHRSEALFERFTPTFLQKNRTMDEYDETMWGLISMFEPMRVDSISEVTYSFEAHGWQIRCFASLEQPQQIQIIRAQLVSGNEVLKRVDLARELEFQQSEDAFSAGLLPMEANGKRIALRRDSSGAVCAELFETAESHENLFRRWTEQGWSLSDASSEQTLAISENLLPFSSSSEEKKFQEQVKICSRGKDSVCVVLSPFLDSGTRTVLILRLSY
jgi:hypothetical protein